jgi:hypothetical protein
LKVGKKKGDEGERYKTNDSPLDLRFISMSIK